MQIINQLPFVELVPIIRTVLLSNAFELKPRQHGHYCYMLSGIGQSVLIPCCGHLQIRRRLTDWAISRLIWKATLLYPNSLAFKAFLYMSKICLWLSCLCPWFLSTKRYNWSTKVGAMGVDWCVSWSFTHACWIRCFDSESINRPCIPLFYVVFDDTFSTISHMRNERIPPT